LTAAQKKALRGLLNFNDDGDDQVLYINEIPRPSEPWFVILNKIAPHLLMEPFRTFDVPEDVKCDGWHRIMTALKEHGPGLSLPPGAASYEEVVPADLRHRLWLQFCCDPLSGLGQHADMTLEDPEEHYRVDQVVDRLREHKESVDHFKLTTESLGNMVILPAKDHPIFVKLMREKLGLGSGRDAIADGL
jgi:hypothetical protein